MKWEKVKDAVGSLIYTSIVNGNTDIMPQILIDNMFMERPAKETIHHYKLFPKYADFSYNVVQKWDIRMAGKLRELFPDYFPKSLKNGKLVAEYDDDGDWSILAVK